MYFSLYLFVFVFLLPLIWIQVDLDIMLQSVIDSSTNEQGVQLCTEAACVLIELVKMIICKVWKASIFLSTKYTLYCKGLVVCLTVAYAFCALISLTKPITGSGDSWDVQYPGSVMQFLCLVHSNYPRDALWASSDFLSSLASAVFPTEITEVKHKDPIPSWSKHTK